MPKYLYFHLRFLDSDSISIRGGGVVLRSNFLVERNLTRSVLRWIKEWQKIGSFLIPVLLDLPYGLVVRIPAFHAGGPGSIPGVGTHFVDVQTMYSGIDLAILQMATYV